MIVVLALAMAVPATREEAMERCAEAVVATLHPRVGMLDTTGIRFEWRRASTAGTGWVIIGAVTEPAGAGRVTRRFRCVTHTGRKPTVHILGTTALTR